MRRSRRAHADAAWVAVERELLAHLAAGGVDAQARRAVAKARADAGDWGTPCLTDVRFSVDIKVEVRP
jgi:hypothetical protein